MNEEGQDILRETRNGNVCSLCEKSISWVFNAKDTDEAAIPLNYHRAICKKCYDTLNNKRRK